MKKSDRSEGKKTPRPYLLRDMQVDVIMKK